MSGRPLRFLHTSDHHLEQPLQGVAEVPDFLRDLFLDAAFQASQRVFDVAAEEQVEFVVMVGDMIPARGAGARGWDFLLRQFRRLDELGVGVFWACGGVDEPGYWPAGLLLPPNVVIFGEKQVEAHTFLRDGQPRAVIQGRAAGPAQPFSTREFDADATLRTIAAVSGRPHEPRFDASDVDYWALGGVHDPQVIDDLPHVAYSGSPQGRRPQESGPHGCLLVEIDDRGRVERRSIACDVVRWNQVEIELPDSIDQAGLFAMLRDKSHQALEAADGRQVILRWRVTDANESSDTRSDVLMARLREGELSEEILQALRHEFGDVVPGVWHESIDVEPPARLPAGWYEEDTILGDLLRSVQHFQSDSSLMLPADVLPADATISHELLEQLKFSLREDRDAILRRVAALGVDLLRGDRVLSEEDACA